MYTYANLHVDVPLQGPFTYAIPDGMNIEIGMRVKINFAGRNTTGFIIELHNNKPKDFEVKNILEQIDKAVIFDNRFIQLVSFIAQYYQAYMGEVFSLALPSGIKESSRYRIPFETSGKKEPVLSKAQLDVYSEIIQNREEGNLTHLLFGITGSGKTEIYIKLALDTIKKGKSVIYLVPEISLSSQLFQRLYAVFGDDMIIYHSHLTQNQRLYNWNLFYNGEKKIIIGTRSAVFLQSPSLGLIIIDEEHDGSYKENSTPRYNARRVAFYRSKTEDAMVILGSATPSIESLYACENNIIQLHTLNIRYGTASIPKIEIVETSPHKPEQMISPYLKLLTKKAIDNGKQVILLLNRRGFSPLMLCDNCGWNLECSSCSIAMNFHKEGVCVCHYCGQKRNLPNICPVCGSSDLHLVGTGTQRIEDLVEKEFKNYSTFRLDQDSARKKNTIFDLIERMNNGEVDILIGTQMVAKGFDFSNITVVGVLLADIGLHMPDFRATERIFSLLMQVAGRAGRGEESGHVIIQTLSKENKIFEFLKNQDFMSFYKYELSVRKELNYPPFSRMARLLLRGIDENKVSEHIAKLRILIDTIISKEASSVMVLGPTAAPFHKIANKYRYHILLKSQSIGPIHSIISQIKGIITDKNLYLEIDIDPFDIM